MDSISTLEKDLAKSDSKEATQQVIEETVRELQARSLRENVGHDVEKIDDDNTKYIFKGTEEQLLNIIREVIFEDPETRAYARKTDEMLKEWNLTLEKEERMIILNAFLPNE